jgi:hypothetical protein
LAFDPVPLPELHDHQGASHFLARPQLEMGPLLAGGDVYFATVIASEGRGPLSGPTHCHNGPLTAPIHVEIRPAPIAAAPAGRGKPQSRVGAQGRLIRPVVVHSGGAASLMVQKELDRLTAQKSSIQGEDF